MAPVTRRQKKALAAAAPPPLAIDPADAVIDPNDRISNLPPEIQAHILSFLPAQEAVRTCVLSRTWRQRQVWRFTRRLLITANSVQEARQFVDRLLRVRLDGLKDACLHECEIWCDPFEMEDEDEDEVCLNWEDMCSINRWIRRVLKCQIQMLRVDISARADFNVYLQMSKMPLLVSRHLTRLELTGVLFDCPCINLNGCPELEQLEINECWVEDVRKITSLSLKRLVITSCESNHDRKRFCICVPHLVYLWLDDNHMRTPLLERMPELVGAKLRIGTSEDWCSCKDPMACYHVTRDSDTSDSDDDEEDSDGDYAMQNTTKCVVLECLAQAEDLELIVDHKSYIFSRDLRWCPTFCKLKTLVLNEIYGGQPADYCSALACMLEHAPLLEKLTLILGKVWWNSRKYKVELKGYPDAKVKSIKISQHLQIVEINCDNVNEGFLSVLSFLGTLNICFEIRVTKT